VRSLQRVGDDAGRIALLVLVDVLVAAALIAVVTSATAVHLARHRLQAVADAAALDAADALDRDRFYTRGAGSADAPVPLTDTTVRDAVQAYLAAADAASRFADLAMAPPTGTADGTAAEVTLVATAPVPLLGGLLAGWSDGIRVTVTARARARSPAPTQPLAGP
jgi:uncharacterized membrane protein